MISQRKMFGNQEQEGVKLPECRFAYPRFNTSTPIYLDADHHSWPNEHEKALNTQLCRKPWTSEYWSLWKARKIRPVKKIDNEYLKKKIKIQGFFFNSFILKTLQWWQWGTERKSHTYLHSGWSLCQQRVQFWWLAIKDPEPDKVSLLLSLQLQC